MKKIILIIFVLSLDICAVQAQTPNWEWAKTETSVGTGQAICVDGAGNSYVTGFFQNTATFGSIMLTSNANGPGHNLYIVKYNPWGGVIWAQNAGGHSGNDGKALAVDDSGNVYLTGTFGDTIVFGTTTLISTYPHPDFFLVKYNSSGNVLWAEELGTGTGSGGTVPYGITTDHSGNIFVTGYFRMTSVTFGSFTLASADNGTSEDVFLVKCDPAGNVLWAKMAGSTSGAHSNSVTTDAAGNSYMTGWFTSPNLTFGFSTITNTGNYNGFLTRYDPNGNVVWAKAFGGVGAMGGDYGNAVSANAAGYCYVTGTMSSLFMIAGTDTIFNSDTATSTSDFFLIKYAPNGTVVWTRSAGSPGTYDYGNAVVSDSVGRVYVTGEFGDSSITFGSVTTNTVNGSANIFVAEFLPGGNALWAKAVGDTQLDEGTSIDINPSGDCYITGFFLSPSITFGSFVLPNPNGYQQFYIAKTGEEAGIQPLQNPGSAISIFPNPSNGIFQLEISEDDFVTWKGKAELEVYDVLGNVVFKSAITAAKSEIDLSGREKGIYFYRVMRNGEIVGSGKLLVE